MRTLSATLVAILFALALLTPVEARYPGPQAPPARGSHRHVQPAHRVLAVQRTRAFTVDDSLAAISEAAQRWGVSYDWLLRVARCESGLNPYAYNPAGPSGLFQFMPGTYALYAARIGETRPLWNPYASANVAAFMFSIGLAYEWGCR